MGVEVINRM